MRTQTQKTSHSTKADPVSSQRSSTPQYSHPVLKLQQQIGNQAVQRLLQSGYIQAKLTIGQPDDIYEQEADRVADQIMRTPHEVALGDMPDPSETEQSHNNLSNQTPVIQRVCPESKKELQRQPTEEIEEEEENLLQAKEMLGQTPEVSNELEGTINSLSGGGQVLSSSARHYMEPRFGRDLSHVRVHTDAHADNVAQSINARAFTLGQDVVFGSGQYSPGTSEGKRLLAHELVHVVQQNRGGNAGLKKAPVPFLLYGNPAVQRILKNGQGESHTGSPDNLPFSPISQILRSPLSIQKQQGGNPPNVANAQQPQVTPATNQQRREFVEEAIQFLDEAAEFYFVQRRTDQARLDSMFDGITRTYTNNENIINSYLNSDAALTTGLKQAYQRALQSLLENGAALLNILLKGLFFRYIDRIPPWAWLDFSQSEGTVRINGTVGLDGNNAPDDVRNVQQRLVELGYLTQQEFIAERPAAQAVPGAQAPIAINTIPRTMNAIRRFSQAAFGRPSLVITPAQASLSFLNTPLPQPLGRINIAADVGRGGTNNAVDVRAVQQRLREINLLSQADYQAELVAANEANVNQNNIQNTIQAIARLHRELAGSNLWGIRPDSREEEVLNTPPRFRVQALEFSNSVGQAKHNAPADVRLLQDRLLNLSYLTQAHFDAEVVEPANLANPAQIPDNLIQQTIAALVSFQVARGLNGNGQLAAGSETHRMLIRPGLPTVRVGNLNATVGVGVGGGGAANINQAVDVRMVQERLHELGFLSSTDFLSERVDPAAGGNIAVAQLARTIDAIREFQGLVVGRTDGNIDPGGMSLRILNDPTYGSLTTFNPEANNPQAGIAFGGAGGAMLNRLIQAVEQAEAGNRTGEVPAGLINAAGVPASFGAGQMIGGTALGVLINPANNQLRDQYGLDIATLNTINDRATETTNRYNAIYGLVAAGGETDANLQALYNAYITANSALFHTDTGLFDQDIINMFRIAQIRRRIIAHPVPHGRQPDTTVVNTADINPAVIALLANAHFLESYNALGFNRSSLRAYVRRTDSLGENRAGFVTKAIFSHPDSQNIRNAMTDASGAAIGRILIQQNFNAANAVVPAGQANRDRVVAAIAAILHNRGGNAQNRFNNLAATLGDNYVVRVLVIWDNL